jgi:hypothetical protein
MATYDATSFRATHNSYSGGLRRSIVDQLRGGVRCFELDVHAKGFDIFRDFRVGYLKPGSEVSLGDGNPESIMLSDWLATIAR